MMDEDELSLVWCVLGEKRIIEPISERGSYAQLQVSAAASLSADGPKAAFQFTRIVPSEDEEWERQRWEINGFE